MQGEYETSGFWLFDCVDEKFVIIEQLTKDRVAVNPKDP
jgi:hypothetical protein